MRPPVDFLSMDYPDEGSVREIVDGVLWVRMPLPFQLNHVNLWLLEDGDGWVLIDTGINSFETRELWGKLLQTLPHGGRISRLICTHAHPDHIGLAGWFGTNFSPDLITTRNELRDGIFFCQGWEDKGAELVKYFRTAGCTGTQVMQIREHVFGSHHFYSGMPASCNIIANGDTVEIGGRQWRVMVAYGHSSEHVCLFCHEAGVLIGGDQILPKITPTIVLPPDRQDGNPLAAFLESNQQFRCLPEKTLILPGHNRPFYGLHARLDEYELHHDDRLGMTFSACSVARSGAEVAARLFKLSSDPHQLFFAVGETLSHIRYLEIEGKISVKESEDGVKLFKQAA